MRQLALKCILTSSSELSTSESPVLGHVAYVWTLFFFHFVGKQVRMIDLVGLKGR